jgi:hypothetical protein
MGIRIPPFYFNADPIYHFNADPDPTFYFNADPDPALHQSDPNQRSLVYRLSRAPFLASTSPFVGAHGPTRRRFEPLKLLKFDFYADKHFTQMQIRIWRPIKMRIRIRNPGLSACTCVGFDPLPFQIGISALQRLVFSSTGPLDRDYDDLRRFSGTVLFLCSTFEEIHRLHVISDVGINRTQERKCREVFLKNHLLEERGHFSC